MPYLFVISTPIGNLEDITIRAIRHLDEVDLIAAEDTRKTGILLKHYGISTKLISFHEYNKWQRITRILDHIENGDVALVSDAGVPTLSDPGSELVQRVIKAGFKVIPIPGPSAVTAALSVSGFRGDSFSFTGFLPRVRSQRKKILKILATEQRTLIVFEAPHRMRATLKDIDETFGDRLISISRELTKLHEETFRGSASEALNYFQQPKGEFTLVIEGSTKQADQVSDEAMIEKLSVLKSQEISARDAAVQLNSLLGVPKNRVYRLWLRLD